MTFKTITFYKYVPVGSPEQLRDGLRQHGELLHLKGRILIASEGINAAVSGNAEEIEEFKKFIITKPEFSDLTFREQETEQIAHHKLVVRVRNEIVHFGEKVDLQNAGKHLQPSTLKQWYDEDKPFIIVDARNDYEYKVGKFKGALGLPIHNFRDFSSQLDFFQQHKDETIVLYCTGGVRCEKASAFLKENGIDNVYQVDGGIISYIHQFPDTYWEGGLFVFDDRLVTEESDPITHCQFCGREEEKYTNCHNLDCDKLFIACENCLQEKNKVCSDECRNSERRRIKV